MLLTGVEKQMFLSSVLDNIDIMIWIKDSHGNLIYMNNIAINILFENADDITKEKCPLSCDVSNHVTQKEDIIEKIEKKNGEVIWLSCKKIPLEENGGGMLVFAEDITERVLKDKKIMKKLNDKLDDWSIKRKKSEEKTKKDMDNMHSILNNIKLTRRKKSE